MEIKMLNFTLRTHNFLVRNNITEEILKSYDLPTFQKEYFKPNHYILNEILERGYLKPKNGEKYVRDLENISKRLRKILEENNIFYLSQLKYCSETEILRYRNLGTVTFNELKALCSRYNVKIYSMPKIPEHWKRKRYYQSLESYCAKKQVNSLDIFKDITTYELYNMVEQDYILTAILYIFLIDIQTFKPWEDAFIFQYFDMFDTRKIFHEYKLMYMSDLLDFYENSTEQTHFFPIIVGGLKKWKKETTNNH